MIFPQNFAATYKEARQKYLDAARNATLFVHHINPKATGLLGEGSLQTPSVSASTTQQIC